MNIAIIGYGRMGHAVEAQALQCGHQVVLRIDSAEALHSAAAQLAAADVAIEFSQPAVAASNLRFCIETGVPTVCGTTGWYDHYTAIADLCHQRGGRLLTATNFAIGVNIMFALNRKLAALMSGLNEYQASITETHHIHKLDAPSGTAISLQQQIVEADGARQVPIESVRQGEVPGTHTVAYTSAVDTITLTHQAHNRTGLAVGAVVAATWLHAAAPGVYTMNDVLNL